MFDLFYFIIFITFCNAYFSKIIPYILKTLLGGPSEEYVEMKEQVSSMIAELSQLSITEEWAKYAKLQRKINKGKDDLAKLGSESSERMVKTLSSVKIIVRIVLGLLLAFTVMMNRSTIVAKLPESWLWPFQSLICWSRDVPGGITVPTWVIISSSVARVMAS